MEKVCEVYVKNKEALMGLVFDGGVSFSELDDLEQFYVIKDALEWCRMLPNGEWVFGVEDFIKTHTPTCSPDEYDNDEITQLRRYESTP